METEHSSRYVVIAFVVVGLALVGGAVLLLLSRPKPVAIVVNPPVPTPTPGPTSTPAPLEVYVTGAVQNPQISVELPQGSRVQDALVAAGGVTSDADLDRVNMSGVLRDGDHIHVFVWGETQETILPTPGDSGTVAINTADAAQLETLPGIGPALAQRIIDHRLLHGPFSDLESLQAVSGIGPAMLSRLDGLVTFD